jgi:hypothetical protein
MSENWEDLIYKFIIQASDNDLKTSAYPKEWSDLKLRISFGMGAPARVPWIAFIPPDMQVSKGYYPVYLYYKDLDTLILAYGVSETAEFDKSWPPEITSSAQTITTYFGREVPRYGDSFIFKAYKIEKSPGKTGILRDKTDDFVEEKELESDLNTLLNYYKSILSSPGSVSSQIESQGLFYMEKTLENFIIENWKSTEFSKRYDLIYEEGELVSQQYSTEIGPIDILARDKVTKNYVVIELKKNQTSDDTIGQIARYMGWIKQKKGDNGVRGIIIAGQFDKRLDYALKMIPNVEVFLYEVNFKLREFRA